MKIKTLILINFLIFGIISVSTTISKAATYGLYSDTYYGMKHDTANPPDPDGGAIKAWGGWSSFGNTTLSGEFTDGQEAMKLVWTGSSGGAGWWIQFGYPSVQVETDMSSYTGGYLKFDVRTTGEILIKLEWGVGGYYEKYLSTQGVPLDNQWHSVSIPLAQFVGVNLSRIRVPAGFHAKWDGGPVTYIIDNVRWTTVSGHEFSVTPSSISWNNVTCQIPWVAAIDPLEVSVVSDDMNWGVQIYTDNTESDANPRWVGDSGTNPCGLLKEIPGQSTSTVRLPLCWRILDKPTDMVYREIYETVDTDIGGAYHLRCPAYGNPATTNYNCWFWMKDEQSPDDPVNSTSAFVAGEEYVTCWNENGIHTGEGLNWGGKAYSPNYIYVGAKFTGAAANSIYKTNKLIVELFYE